MTSIIKPSGVTLAAKALTVGQAFAASGLHEDNNDNHSAELDKIESLFGLSGEPYCAMGVAFCYMKSFAFLTNQPTTDAVLRHILQHDLPRYFDPSPSTGQMMRSAKAAGLWRPFVGLSGIRQGEPVLFSFNGDDKPEHVGLFQGSDNGRIVAVEFNTGSGETGNQADGGGCYQRVRNTGVVLGSIAVSKVGAA